MSDSISEDDSWVFDSLVNFLHGAIWKLPVLGFIEEKSVVFDPDSYNNMTDDKEEEFRKIHDEYKALVDYMLTSFMEDLQVTPEQVEQSCRLRELNNKAQPESHITKVALDQLWAAEDFGAFRRLMTRKNIDLQLQSLELLVAKYGVLSPSLRPPNATDDENDPNGEEDFLQVVIRYTEPENTIFHSSLVTSSKCCQSPPHLHLPLPHVHSTIARAVAKTAAAVTSELTSTKSIDKSHFKFHSQSQQHQNNHKLMSTPVKKAKPLASTTTTTTIPDKTSINPKVVVNNSNKPLHHHQQQQQQPMRQRKLSLSSIHKFEEPVKLAKNTSEVAASTSQIPNTIISPNGNGTENENEDDILELEVELQSSKITEITENPKFEADLVAPLCNSVPSTFKFNTGTPNSVDHTDTPTPCKDREEAHSYPTFLPELTIVDSQILQQDDHQLQPGQLPTTPIDDSGHALSQEGDLEAGGAEDNGEGDPAGLSTIVAEVSQSQEIDEETAVEMVSAAPEQHRILTAVRRALDVPSGEDLESFVVDPSTSELPIVGSEEEIERRREYLRSQRDKLVALKKREREKQLVNYDRKGGTSSGGRPKSAKAAHIALKSPDSITGINNDKSLQARRALAQRLKQELVEHP